MPRWNMWTGAVTGFEFASAVWRTGAGFTAGATMKVSSLKIPMNLARPFPWSSVFTSPWYQAMPNGPCGTWRTKTVKVLRGGRPETFTSIIWFSPCCEIRTSPRASGRQVATVAGATRSNESESGFGAACVAEAASASVARARSRAVPGRVGVMSDSPCGNEGSMDRGLSVVAVAARGGPDGRVDQGRGAGEDPRLLAGSETRGEVAVVELARHGEAVVGGRRQEEARVVDETVRRAVDVAFDGRDHAVAVLIDPIHLEGVGVEEAHRERRRRLERGDPLVDVEVDLAGEAARDEAVAELALRVVVAVELVGVAGEERAVPVD